MSLFVDVRGRLDPPEQIDELIEFLAAECQTRHWPYRILDDVIKDVAILLLPVPGDEQESKVVEEVDEDGQTQHVAKDECDSMYRERLHRRGIRIWPHYRSAVVSLIFDTETGEVVGHFVFHPAYTPFFKAACKHVQNLNFAKTVYAGANTHRDVCEVMKAAMECFKGLNITDTGDYLETGDMEELRSIVREHVTAVGILNDALENLPDGKVLRGDKEQKVPLEREIVYREIVPYERLTLTQRETLETAIQNTLSNLGFSDVNRKNAEDVLTALDGFIEQNREELNSDSEEEKEQVYQVEYGLAACFGTCIITFFGGHWIESPEDHWWDTPFTLIGVSVARINFDPFEELARCINAREENETLAQLVDDIRFQEESYIATYHGDIIRV